MKIFKKLFIFLFAVIFLILSSDIANGRRLKPDKEVINGITVALNYNLNRNIWTENDFAIDENGRFRFLSGNFYTGIDVSYHQGKINWKQVSQYGIDFAFIRAGSRGYSKSIDVINADEQVQRNLKLAHKYGIAVGLYFFSQAITEAEAIEEADLVIEQINDSGITPDLPIVFDWENIENSENGARTDDAERETVTKCAIAFCEEIEKHGFQSAIYCNNVLGYLYYDWGQLQDYTVWYSSYGNSYPNFYYKIDIWQYSQTGKVSGIDGYVDLDIMPIESDILNFTYNGSESTSTST